ncbi:MAG: DUF4442 domain-containing protein [Anaerolineae bacterium]|nr:DUF4442 domain-containing protein [Anaerolineae bacterium]
MAESFRTRVRRIAFNFFPAYRRTGGRIIYMADDGREARVKVDLNWTTRNYVGTIFGGSMYGAVDPIYMVMLIRVLGSDYIVWDKAAAIRFKKPGKTTLYAHFKVDDAELQAIQDGLMTQPSLDRIYTVDLVDSAGVVHATIEKTIYIRRKDSGKKNDG